MKKQILNIGYNIIVLSVVLCFSGRIYHTIKTELARYDALIFSKIEDELAKQVVWGNRMQLEQCTPLGFTRHIPEYVMASRLRTGTFPPIGLLQKAYDNGYDDVVEDDINIPKDCGVYYNNMLMLYSAGADEVFGTTDDLGVAVESMVVDVYLAEILGSDRKKPATGIFFP